jgi:glucosamine kinase
MILVADSGSTKTEWALAKHGHADHFTTSGINPMIQTREEIDQIVDDLTTQLTNSKVDAIYFYGAGCSSAERNKIVHSSLKKSFPAVEEIMVDHDLLGACRALFGNEKGIAAILGTGSNACYFDGKEIIQRVPSLGFILGDEGSGSYMGKKLLKDYFYKMMPDNLSEKFESEYNLDKDHIFRNVYKVSNASKFLATFARFLNENIEHEEYLQELVYDSFSDFFITLLLHYNDLKEHPLGFVGSISYLYQDILSKVASQYHFHLKKVIQKPLKDLVEYHLEEK